MLCVDVVCKLLMRLLIHLTGYVKTSADKHLFRLKSSYFPYIHKTEKPEPSNLCNQDDRILEQCVNREILPLL